MKYQWLKSKAPRKPKAPQIQMHDRAQEITGLDFEVSSVVFQQFDIVWKLFEDCVLRTSDKSELKTRFGTFILGFLQMEYLEIN